MTGKPGRSGGYRPGAGRPPADGQVKALIREAAGILAGNGSDLYDLVRRDSVDRMLLEGYAVGVARDAMRASRRLQKAARLVGS